MTVPTATVERLPSYLQVLDRLPDAVTHISSEELASAVGTNSAKVRKDLSYLGSHGTRGVGYHVESLAFEIRRRLGLTRDWAVVIVGVGNLGTALANFGGFSEQGFQIVGLFDADPNRVGTVVGGVEVEPVSRLTEALGERTADIGVITVPAAAAQDVATALADAGISSILNFAPAAVKVPSEVEVRRVDLSKELQVLSYYLHHAGA